MQMLGKVAFGEFMFCKEILRMSKQVLFVPECVYIG